MRLNMLSFRYTCCSEPWFPVDPVSLNPTPQTLLSLCLCLLSLPFLSLARRSLRFGSNSWDLLWYSWNFWTLIKPRYYLIIQTSLFKTSLLKPHHSFCWHTHPDTYWYASPSVALWLNIHLHTHLHSPYIHSFIVSWPPDTNPASTISLVSTEPGPDSVLDQDHQSTHNSQTV